jgi:Predicted divalent heavy-metal cations transporter
MITPLVLGALAGITVFVGAFSASCLTRSRAELVNSLGAGILLFIALEAASDSQEAVKGLFDELLILSAFVLTLILISGLERHLRISERSLTNSGVIAVALGVHNVGEGFAIASALLAGQLSSALAFTLGFSIHNATEGVAISAPMSKRRLGFLALLSAVAGLPTILGASVYYLGYAGGLEIGVLDAIAFASVLYAFVKIFRDRGVSSWILMGLGFALGTLTELLISYALGNS